MQIMPMAQRFAVAAGVALTLSACEPVNLYVAHSTVVGLNAAGSLDRSSGHLIVGYDRHFGAIVPKSVRFPSAISSLTSKRAWSGELTTTLTGPNGTSSKAKRPSASEVASSTSPEGSSTATLAPESGARVPRSTSRPSKLRVGTRAGGGAGR